MSEFVSNFYPFDVLDDPNRCIKVLAKENAALNGAADELLANVNKASNDLKSLFSGSSSTTATTIEDVLKLPEKTKKLTVAETVYGLALPLPNQLDDSQSHQWDTSTGFVANTVGGMVDNANVGIAGIKSSLNGAIGELASSSGFRKPLIDPGYFQDYKGTEPRSFTFSWDLIPDSRDDAEELLVILYNLKKYTLPTTTINGVSLMSPYVFDLEIGNPYINSVMNMNNVVCQSMNITFSADGSLQFFEDGFPKYIRLEMSFAERALVTSDFY